MFRPSDDHPDYPRGSRGHYDRDQPRVPPGHPDGGQWTSADGWPLSDLAELPAPDLRKPDIPRIAPGMYPEYALVDEKFLASRSDASSPTKLPALLRSANRVPWWVALFGIGLWWLREQLSSKDDGDGKYVVVGVRARKFGLRDPSSIGLISEDELTLEQTKKYCPDIELVQRLVDLARKHAGDPKNYHGKDDGAYGKAVDDEFKRLLREVNADRISKGEPGIFIIDKTFGSDGKDAHPNTKNAKTPDAYQKLPDNACVYLIDTEAGGGDDRDNMLAVAVNMSKHESMTGITTFIMTRVRPSTPPPPPKRKR